MVDDSSAPIGITGYAKHRGCSAAAVHKAIRSGRLRGCVIRVQGRTLLRSADAADREWEQRTDRSRRPEYARSPLAAPPTSGPCLLAESGGADNDGSADDVEGPESSDPVLADYQREAMRERARKLKLENDVAEGKLVSIEEAKREAFDFARVIRENIFNIPARLAAELAADSDEARVYRRLDGALREALESTVTVLEAQADTTPVQTSAQQAT